MQQHKSDFLSRDGINNASYLSQSLASPRSPYEVKAGTIIPTSLITGINSDLPGQVIGQVRENVYDTVTGNHLLIPQGSRLLATYDSSVTFGQERVLVCWNRLIRPDGSSIPLECMPGVDLAGYAGFADQVDNHWWRIITGVALGHARVRDRPAQPGRRLWLQPDDPAALGRERRRRSQPGRPGDHTEEPRHPADDQDPARASGERHRHQGHRPHPLHHPRSLAMSTKNVRDEQLEDQAIDIAARFPEVHDPRDCLETVRLIRGLFDAILEREGVTDGLDAPALDESVYSVADAEKLSKKLRSLAHWRGITPVLTTRQLLVRLSAGNHGALGAGATRRRRSPTC